MHPLNEKPRSQIRDRGFFVSKRVRRFERPTFTLATCSHTDLKTSSGPISCDGGKGVTNTVTSPLQPEVISGDLQRLVDGWATLPREIQQAILRLLDQE